MASTSLSRTPTSGNRRTFTYSAWIKISSTTSSICFVAHSDGTNQNDFLIQIQNDSKLLVLARSGGATQIELATNRLFRDISAWYHIVVAVDTTQATSSNRAKVYVNGSQETSFSTETYPSQNADLSVNNASYTSFVGQLRSGVNNFDGLMSHIHFTDGYAYAPTDFGETDSTTGEWKIKTSPSVTYGTNGFFILKDGNSVTDQSGNGNNFTVAGGTLTKTEDCPSNVFATWNALTNTGLTLQNGNTYTVYASNDHNCKTTLGMNSGKYYWEMKPNGVSGTVSGICRDTTKQQADISNTVGQHVYGMQYNSPNVSYKTNGTFTSSSSWGTYVSGDIVQFAYDADNGKLFIGKNGTYKDFSGNTGDPVNGTYPTFSSLDTTATWFPFIEMRGGSENDYWNFGNGYFGTTAISSAGTNASGIGIFEYDVPTGYTALSTKGLNL